MSKMIKFKKVNDLFWYGEMRNITFNRSMETYYLEKYSKLYPTAEVTVGRGPASFSDYDFVTVNIRFKTVEDEMEFLLRESQ